jgi:hypothetical protein
MCGARVCLLACNAMCVRASVGNNFAPYQFWALLQMKLQAYLRFECQRIQFQVVVQLTISVRTEWAYPTVVYTLRGMYAQGLRPLQYTLFKKIIIQEPKPREGVHEAAFVWRWYSCEMSHTPTMVYRGYCHVIDL